MRISLITKDEIIELVDLIDYIDDEQTKKLIRKLHSSYNAVYIGYKEKIKEDKRVNALEVERENEIRKIKKRDKKIANLQQNFKKEIEKNIENTKKLKEAEIRIEVLEGKLKKVGITI